MDCIDKTDNIYKANDYQDNIALNDQQIELKSENTTMY
jgi:hypothetical protein